MMHNPKSALILLAVWTSALIGAGTAFSQEIEVRSDGVRAVKNPAAPVGHEGKAVRLSLIQDLVIGNDPSAGDSSFGTLSAVIVDDVGDIIAYDRKNACFKIFDKNGRFVRRFGRSGQGPGEIQTLMSMSLVGADNIAVVDTGTNRMSVFSKDGVCFRMIPLTKGVPYNAMTDKQGHVYGTVLIFESPVLMKLVKFGPDLLQQATMATLKMPSQNALPPPELTERYYYYAAPDGTLVWGTNYRYSLNVINPEGKLVLTFERAAEPEKLTRARLIQIVKMLYPDRPVPDNMAIPSHYPKNFPFFNAVIGDDEGRIYVRTLAGWGTGTTSYDVFDPAGSYIARFERPEDEEIVAVKKGRAYVRIKENEKGMPLIKRYRLEWR